MFRNNSKSTFSENNGIECPTPLKNKQKHYYSKENCGDETHLIRLFEFIPGKIFNDVSHTPELFYEAGQYTAQIELLLKVNDLFLDFLTLIF